MEWLDERWVGNRHFESCHGCVPPKRFPGCHAKCKDHEADKKAYAKIKESIKQDNEIRACIKTANNRINRHYGIRRKETFHEDNS